ncbi:MAG: galactokinase [Clostridia bacterium]|nr:galactokinase [Clostridia bacterium]
MFIKIQEAYKRGAEAMKQYIFSAPGRTEISGNHTDHQHGCVLAASVNLKTTARVVLNGTSVIRIQSEGYPVISIDLTDLSVRDDEKNSTAALVRGVAAAFAQRGAKLSGFDAQVSSTVLPGSGLSSSAAFEVLIGNILNGLFFENRLDAVEIAKIGQYAENVYFGKPCGLMDQMASSVGSMVFIDFKDEQNPQVERIAFDFAATGHALCIIDTGADHADLTDEYAAITRELKTVCRFFGKEVLRDVPEDAFYKALPEVRAAAGDRAVLRAIHVYNENRRVLCQKQALLDGNFDTFLAYVKESGKSSWCCLQNVIPAGRKEHQEVAVALALAEELLAGSGACRVHGGGFAGTIQAFVPMDRLDSFKAGMEAVLGEGKCHVLSITPNGGMLEGETEVQA